MEYRGTLRISKSDLQYYRDLLSIEDLEVDDKGIGLQDDCISIGSIKFPNNTLISIDLLSGCTNYYDNIVLYGNNEDNIYRELTYLDCLFDICDFELEYDDDIYIIKIEEV